MSIQSPQGIAFAGMKNKESIAMGGRVSRPTPRCLAIEWMLYPDVLDSCPDRHHWDYGMPPLADQKITIEGFEIDLTCDPPGATVRRSESGAEVRLVDVSLSRERVQSGATILCDPEVRFYGLGEQFASLEHTGRRIVCESADWWNKNWFDPPGWKHSFAPIPFLLTSAGYGLLVEGTSRIAFDLREAGRLGGRGRYTIQTESAGLRVTFIFGSSPKEILREFIELTGKPYVPPRWAQEPLLACACNHKERCWTEAKLDEYIDMFQKHRIPNGMVMDEAWTWTRRDASSPSGHYMHYERYGAFEPDNYSDPVKAIERLERQGRSRMIFIIGPFIGCQSQHLDMLKEKGWLVRRASNPAHFLMGQYNHYFLDFTHPDAAAWWKEKLAGVVDLGLSGFFADFGEADEQMDALYFRGGTGQTFGQEYNLIYKKAVREVLERKRGEDFYFIGRAGWTGVQAISGIMQGDPACSFEGMRQSLISLQSSAMTGQAVLSHNLGGYSGEQSALVYLRWIAFGVFCPLQHIWTSGESGGEPWNFRDEQVLETYRTLMEWRMRLLPYLHSALSEYGRSHIPLIRPMALEYPRDPRAVEAVDQFLCGTELLVAPILSADGRRSVYLPAGEWVDFWSLERLSGPGVRELESPLDQIPVFAAEGAIVPLEGNPLFGRDLREEPLEIHVLGRPTGRELTLVDQGRDIALSAASEGQSMVFRSAAIQRRTVTWVWRGCDRPEAVSVNERITQASNGSTGESFDYEESTRTLRMRLKEFPGDTEIVVTGALRGYLEMNSHELTLRGRS